MPSKAAATTRTTRVNSAPHPGNSPGPLKPIMHRCDFLGFRLVHRTIPPRGETRPKQQVHAPPFPWAERNPNSPQHGRPGISDCDDPPVCGTIQSRGSSREETGLSVRSLSRLHAQPSDQNNRGSRLENGCQTKSLCHRITRHSTFIRDIFATRTTSRPETGSSSRSFLVACLSEIMARHHQNFSSLVPARP